MAAKCFEVIWILEGNLSSVARWHKTNRITFALVVPSLRTVLVAPPETAPPETYIALQPLLVLATK